MNKKYELTDEVFELGSGILHRIRALKNFGLVKKGDLGGFVESEYNLSQDGNAWVYGQAKVYNDAEVYGNAKICGNAEVYGNAKIYGYAEVRDYAQIYGYAEVRNYADVLGNAQVYCDAEVCDYAIVSGDVHIHSVAKIRGNAEVKSLRDYTTFKNFWSSGRCITYTASNKMWCTGCFYGTGEELIAKAYNDSVLSGKCYEAIVRVVEAIEKEKDATK